jgi:hypothetical protein
MNAVAKSWSPLMQEEPITHKHPGSTAKAVDIDLVAQAVIDLQIARRTLSIYPITHVQVKRSIAKAFKSLGQITDRGTKWGRLCFYAFFSSNSTPSSLATASPLFDKRLTADWHIPSLADIPTVVIPSFRCAQKHNSALALTV